MEPTPSPNPDPESQTPAAPAEPSVDPSVFGPAQAPEFPAEDSFLPESTERPTAVIFPQQTQTIINGKVVDEPVGNIAGQPAVTSQSSKRSKRLPRKAILVPALVMLVLLGGGAAAYFGYYVPNKPENVLRQAIENSLTEHQATSTGTVDITSSGISGHVDYTAKVNSDSHSLDLNLDTTISGVKIPL